MSDKKAHQETEVLASGVLTKHIFRISSDDGSGNGFMHLSEFAKLPVAILTIAYGDVQNAMTLGTLVPNRKYLVTGMPAYITGQTYFETYYDLTDAATKMSPFGYSLKTGTVLMLVEVDWYHGANKVVRVYDMILYNDVQGETNITTFPFTNTNVTGNKVGSGFTLNISAIGVSQQFKNNTCYGDGVYTMAGGETRHYLGIDFSKKCFRYKGLFSQGSGSSTDDPTSIELINELGEGPVLARDTDGDYRLTTTNFKFTENKTYLRIDHPSPDVAQAYIGWVTDTRINIKSYDVTFLSFADALLNNIAFEIEVYF